MRLFDLQRALALVPTRLLLGLIGGQAVVFVDHGAAEVVGDLDDRAADGLSGRSLLVLAEAAGEAAARDTAGDAVAGGAALHGAGELDFARGGIHHTEIDGEVGFLFLASEADASEPDSSA